MAHQPTQLRRSNSITLTGNVKVHFFDYATNHTKAETIAAGYFNDSRAALSVSSIIDAVIDVDGTPAYVKMRVTAVPASGNVTVTDITGSSAG
ncbi:hypothetical protein [Rhizobium sp. SGZ-381]|uniref:hypothetical protein n=1 Tax=Rhizobium sp. SGZ-381 TaxID=3342800 RepID=UPI0036713E64